MRHTARNLSVLGLGLGVSTVIGWLLLKENKRQKAEPTVAIRSQVSAESSEIPQIILPLQPVEDEIDTPDPATPASQADDLTLIHDIGPRFAEALHAIGITHFNQLAQETPETLARKLAQHVTVRPQRILVNDWIGQAANLAHTNHR